MPAKDGVMIMFVAMSDRSEALRLFNDLKARAIDASVISTPKGVSTACGLSVRFGVTDLARVRSVLTSRPRRGVIGTFKSVQGVVSRLF